MKFDSSTTPFFSLLASLATGILIACLTPGLTSCIGLIFCALIIYIYRHTKLSSVLKLVESSKYARWQTFFLVSSLGTFSVWLNNPGNPTIDYNDYTHVQGDIIDVNNMDSCNRYLFEVHSFCNINDKSAKTVPPFNIWLYCNEPELAVGDKIQVLLMIKSIANNPNFIDTDFNENLFPSTTPQYKITATKYDLTILENHSNSLRYLPHKLRNNLILTIKNSKLNNNSQQLLTAMLLAESEWISKNTKEIFRKSGIAHILAVSGLHVGIIASLVLLFLAPTRLLHLGKVRYIIAIILMWLYVIICGTPPSAIRACLMVSLCLTASMVEREYNALNTLCAAVFIILVFSPFQLFNPSLQFSFTAVFALISIAPAIIPISAKRKILYKFCSAIVATIVATVATWGLTAYWFGNIQLISLPANILVLPLLPLYMGSAILHIILCSIGITPDWIAFIINAQTDIIINIATFVSNSSIASIELPIRLITCLLFFLMLISLSLLVLVHKKIYAVSSCLFFIFTIVSGIVFPSYKNKISGYIITNNSGVIIRNYNAGKDSIITTIPQTTCSLHLHGDNILTVCNKISSHSDSITSCDILVIGYGFSGKAKNLLQQTNPNTVVLANGLSVYRATEITEECNDRKIPCHNIAEEGPYQNVKIIER